MRTPLAPFCIADSHRCLSSRRKFDTLLHLLGDRLADQHRVGIGIPDLDDLDRHLPAGHRHEVGGEPVDLGALGADDQAGPRGLHDDRELFTRALDQDVRHGRERRRPVESLVDVLRIR